MEAQHPCIQDHLSYCRGCADTLALIRRAAADRSAFSRMTEEESDRVACFVVGLIRDRGF